MSIHAIYRDDELIIAINGVPYTVYDDDDNYDLIAATLLERDEDKLKNLLSIKKKAKPMFDELQEYGFEYVDGEYTYMGNELPMDLNDYLLSAIDAGDWSPIVRFIERLYENPNHTTRMNLFEFMEENKMPIADDGRFLAFKAVRSDYMDKHSGTVYNGVGAIMPKLSWSEVDTDPSVTCSRGFHACSKSYIDDFFYNRGDRVVTVAIAPEDVGAVPRDYQNSKLRCRGYEVLADITDEYASNAEMKLRAESGLNATARNDDKVRRVGSYW